MFSPVGNASIYDDLADQIDAQRAAIEKATEVFNKRRCAHKIITLVAKGEMTVETACKNIKKVLREYASLNYTYDGT